MTQQPQQSEGLRFPVRITVAPDGLHIEVEFVGRLDQIPAAIERLRAAGVLDLVKPNAPQASTKAKAAKVQPAYDGAGTPICPKHGKILREGQYGLFCPAKDDTTERGYCALKFEA